MDEDQILIIVENNLLPLVLGVEDANIRYLEQRIQARITVRDNQVRIFGAGSDADKLTRVINDLAGVARQNGKVTIDDIAVILRLAGINGEKKGGTTVNGGSPVPEYSEAVILDTPRGQIKPRGIRQANYVKMIDRLPIVFGIGPAGTGKTYLAVAMAIDKLQRRLVDKIILTRPVIESGEALGFLPGDILEKVDPYFRPLYDALDEMLSTDRVKRYIDKGIIEVAPLAYMRGRTLNNAVVILDEAQNTTSGQMKMFLTRLGVQSSSIITGDLTQIDLPKGVPSGLAEAQSILQGIQGIGFVEFNDTDVVRHKLVADILRAYDSQKVSRDGTDHG